MQQITVTQQVAAPPERVWAVLTDLDRLPDVLAGVEALHVLTDGPYAVGTRWWETRRMFGARATEELEVVENDPARRTVLASSTRGVDYRTETTLEPSAPAVGGTTVTIRFTACTPQRGGLAGLVDRLTSPLGARVTRRMLAQDLADLAAAAER